MRTTLFVSSSPANWTTGHYCDALGLSTESVARMNAPVSIHPAISMLVARGALEKGTR